MKLFKGILFALISSSTFGLIPFFALPAMEAGVGIDSLVFYRFGFASLLLGAYLIIKKTDFRINRKELLSVFLLGTAYASTAFLLTTAYQYIASGVATTIHFLYPVAVAAVMVIFFRDKLSWPVLLSIIVSFAGVYLLSFSGDGQGIHIPGLLLVLLTVLTYATYIVGVNKSRVREMDGLKLAFYVLLTGALLFGAQLLVKGEALDPFPSFSVALDVVLLAFVSTLISDLTLIWAIQLIGSTRTAILGCMEPVTAVVMGFVAFGEELNLSQGVGIGLVIVAVMVVILGGKREVAPQDA